MDLRVGLARGAPIAYACGAVRWVLPTLCVSEEEGSVPRPGDSHRQATPDRHPTAANGPAMGGGRAGLGVLESPTHPTVVVGLRARPPDPHHEKHMSCVCWYA
jgi:hypothetical protein